MLQLNKLNNKHEKKKYSEVLHLDSKNIDKNKKSILEYNINNRKNFNLIMTMIRKKFLKYNILMKKLL